MKIENREKVLEILERIRNYEERRNNWERSVDIEDTIIGIFPSGRSRLFLDGIKYEMLKAQSISYYEEEIAKLINELEEL